MAATDATIMDNWFPSTTSVSIRNGHIAHVTGFAASVESLMTYRASTTSKMFAASGTAFYDATAAGAVGAAVVSGLTNARWQHANFGTVGGQFMSCVNGVDELRLYNGTTWTTINAGSTPAITGILTSTFKDVQVYGRRLWFTEKNSFRVWYLPLDSIAGAAQSIDFGPLFILGGSLQGMVTWTLSSEYQTINFAVFVSSEGEALIYSGDNPANAATFNLVGQFRIGKPIGQRFYARVGSETVMITEDGLIPLSKAVFINRGADNDAISYKITNLINEDVATYKGLFGWQVILFPKNNMILLNSPRFGIADTIQYVMNTITNAWCRYTGLASYCWALLSEDVFFGGANSVFKAETGYTDNGAGISADLQPAFSYFGEPGVNKLFTAVRPIITTNGQFQPLIRLETDFNSVAPMSAPTLSLVSGNSAWDTAVWDGGIWGGTATISKSWQSVGGIGFAATIRMTSLSKGLTADLQSIDYVFEKGSGQY
jgi:uncharacterized protein YaiE (UPF0345 family)